VFTIYDRNWVRRKAGFSGRGADRSPRGADFPARRADRPRAAAWVIAHDDAIVTGGEASGRFAEFTVEIAEPTFPTEPRHRAVTQTRAPQPRRRSPPPRAAPIRTRRASLATVTAIASHTQPIVVDTNAILLPARRAVLVAEPIGRPNEAIGLIAPSISRVADAHRAHSVARFNNLPNVIGRIAESGGRADDITPTLGAATAIRASASDTERRVHWHRARRSSVPHPPRIAIGEERTATGERSITFDQYEIANRGSLIATCRAARFHQPGGHGHLI
jgi:hypothetical protein